MRHRHSPGGATSYAGLLGSGDEMVLVGVVHTDNIGRTPSSGWRPGRPFLNGFALAMPYAFP